MKTKFFFITAALASLLVFTSCSDDDKWDDMKWTSNTEITNGNEVQVPADGASYSFMCTNYEWVKLSGCSEDGKVLNSISQDKIERDWGSISCKENVFKITFLKNETGKERNVNINVTAGNIFDKFNFKQISK